MLQLYVVWDMVDGDKDNCQPYILYFKVKYMKNEALQKKKDENI